jgi:2-deoxy-D-gluconate 3-dehydrogenase
VPLPADLSGPEGASALAGALAQHEDHLDVLVNNAGQSWGAPLAEFPEKGWDKVMDVNVKGPFFLIQQLLPMLEAAASPDDPARIINIGSIDGLRPPVFETYSYGPSKAAIHALTRQLARELAPRHVNVNAIAPGPYPTWMLSTGVGGGGDVENTDWDSLGQTMPSGRIGTPEDIAGLTIFLSSRAGAFTVGEIISSDGGILVS